MIHLPPIVALEIGTTKVRALVGEDREDGNIMITGLGECPSRGVRKAEIIEPNNATSCVRTALQAAEENAQVTINQVHLLLSGGHIQNLVNRGSVPIVNPHVQITRDDMEDCMDNACAVSISQDREVLHTMYQNFVVDDQEGIINPEGMEGAKLSVDCLILHGVRHRLRNVVKVVKSVPMDVADVAFSGLCAALAVLGPEEKAGGVAVIDLGGGTTDYLVYAGDAIATAGSLAVGGDHITNDIAWGLKIPASQAERLKEELGSAAVSVGSRSQRVSLPGEVPPAERFVKVSDLNMIIHMRMEETLGLIRLQLVNQGLLGKLCSGIIFTGGGARLDGLLDLAGRVFKLPCAIGRPRNFSGLAAVGEGPEYAAPIGMLRYGFKSARRGRGGAGWFNFLGRLFGNP